MTGRLRHRGSYYCAVIVAMLQATLALTAQATYATSSSRIRGSSITEGVIAGGLGCVKSSASKVNQDGLSSQDMTRKLCLEYCREGNYAYYGLELGNKCSCGRSGMVHGMFGESTACNIKCAGDPSMTCGGDDAMQIFSINGEGDRGMGLGKFFIPARLARRLEETMSSTGNSTSAESSVTETADGSATETAESVITETANSSTTETSTVRVDLRPCILSPEVIADTGSAAGPYMLYNFYNGFWGSDKVIIIAPGDDLISEMQDPEDDLHGLCNAVYVGIVPTDAQYEDLKTYSRTFRVRVVYLESSSSAAISDVISRVGIKEYWHETNVAPKYMTFTEEGKTTTRIVNGALKTDPVHSTMFTRPVHIYTDPAEGTGKRTHVAQYLDSTNELITYDGFDSAAMVLWEGTDNLEEMHMFVAVGWFDADSWAWVHHLVEWATKGVFVGERRFYLGAVVDDMFLKTAEFEYGEGIGDDGEVLHEGTEYRCTGDHLTKLKAAQDELNKLYSSSIITEFAFNGAGILEHVNSIHLPAYVETLVTPKGTKMAGDGTQALVHPTDYLTVNVSQMEAEYDNKEWDADDLLKKVLEYTDDFFHGSHTLVHLNRDELQQSDCNIEDGANVQIAVITGMFQKANYNWRSMVSPGITGLFNKNCLESGKNNLMTCYPGDNTYDGINTDTSLISSISPYHSMNTTEATNGYPDIQIVPRFATYVYYNCVSGDCLVKENEYIRRIVCGCSELNPSLDRGTCSNSNEITHCNSDDDIGSFGTAEVLFETEANTTARYMLSGRRDKYMFHQANVYPAFDLPRGVSSLEYWYRKVMAKVASYITFPMTSVKFDDLCVNFLEHEKLDSSGTVVTATFEPDGSISSIALSSSDTAGVVPVTVPTSDLEKISLGDEFTPYAHDTSGTDTIYYFTTPGGTQPTPACAPDVSELAPVGITSTEPEVTISEEAEDELEAESEEAKEEMVEIAAEWGFVVGV